MFVSWLDSCLAFCMDKQGKVAISCDHYKLIYERLCVSVKSPQIVGDTHTTDVIKVVNRRNLFICNL